MSFGFVRWNGSEIKRDRGRIIGSTRDLRHKSKIKRKLILLGFLFLMFTVIIFLVEVAEVVIIVEVV